MLKKKQEPKKNKNQKTRTKKTSTKNKNQKNQEPKQLVAQIKLEVRAWFWMNLLLMRHKNYDFKNWTLFLY